MRTALRRDLTVLRGPTEAARLVAQLWREGDRPIRGITRRKILERRRDSATRPTTRLNKSSSISGAIGATKETPRSSGQSGRKPLVSFQTKAEKAQVTTDEEGGKVGEKFLACQGLLGRDSGPTGIAIMARYVFRQSFFVSSFFSTMTYFVFRNDGEWACVAAAVTALIFS
jgi:hypothetical protein